MIFLHAWDSHWVNLMMLACSAVLLWPKTAGVLRRESARKVMIAALFLMTAAQCVFLTHNMYIFRVATLDYQRKEAEEDSAFFTEYLDAWKNARRTAAEQLVAQCVQIVDTNQMMRSEWDWEKDEVSMEEFIIGAVDFYYLGNEDLIDNPEFQKLHQQQEEELSETIISPYGDCFDLPLGYYACGGFWSWMNWLEHNAYQISFFLLGLICLKKLRQEAVTK